MITATCETNGSPTMWSDADPTIRVTGTFPLHGGVGTKTTAVVYFELEPGRQLGRHTDSAEEVLLILEGMVSVEVNGETGLLTQGRMAVVPEMVPHNVRNVGSTTAKVVGFFPSPRLVATFERPFRPMNQRVIDTAGA